MADNIRRDEDLDRDRNPDAITGAPGSHPIGTGIGAAGAGAAGAAIGSVVPGVGTAVGGAVGAVVGAVAGGLAGKAVAEAVNPTEEDAYWRDNFSSRPYAAGSDYTYEDDFGPAYRHGYTARTQYPGKTYDQVESNLQRDWDRSKGKSRLEWDKAKFAARDAWDRVERKFSRTRDDDVR
jgi:hypothetical protein